MKITFGGSQRMTIQNQPYETVSVESVLIIEKEFDVDPNTELLEELQEKANLMMKKDVEKKATIALKSQQETKNKMKSILKGLV